MGKQKRFSHRIERYIYDHHKLRDRSKAFGKSLKEVKKQINKLEIFPSKKKENKK